MIQWKRRAARLCRATFARNLRRQFGRDRFDVRFLPGDELHVDGVANQKRQASDGRHPDEVKRDMNRDSLPPRTGCELYYAHFASSTPLMARFTRFRIRGIL